MDKILLIIPAYNEEESIERVINNLEKNFPQYDYVIVNDGSKDKTEQAYMVSFICRATIWIHGAICRKVS